MVLAASHGISRVPRYSGTCPPSQSRFRLQDCHLLWSRFPADSTNDLVVDSAALRPDRPYNPREHALWFGLLRVRSPLLAESLSCFLFLQVLRWFTSLRCLPRAYEFSTGSFEMNRRGFPHSDIPGSTPACGSPGLIAACHVLHRLLVPRHSPYALSSLTKCFTYTLRVCDQRTTDCGVFNCQRAVRTSLRVPQILSSRSLRLASVARAKSGVPSVAHALRLYGPTVARFASDGGHPSPAFVSEGWWRIPGSNR
jgi:hypothetical protein